MIKLIKWLVNLLGWEVVMVKISKDRSKIDFLGNPELLKHTDIYRYTTKQSPLDKINKP